MDLDESGDDHEPFVDRAAETIAFGCFADDRGGAGSEKSFVVVGHADGHARMWHAREGRLAMDFHAGHRPGESVTAIAVNVAGTRVVTGDSVGRLRLWNVSRVVDALQALERGAANEHRVFGRDDVELMGYWQAHASRSCVRDVSFFVAPDGAGCFFVSGGSDTKVHVWDEDGRHVGRLGPDRWNLADDATWRSRERPAGGEVAVAKAGKTEEKAVAETVAKPKEKAAAKTKEKTSDSSSEDDELDAAAYAAAVDAAIPPPPRPPLALEEELEPSASRPSSSTLSPEPSGYLPVRPSEDRRLWTRNVPESFEATDTYRAIVTLEERKHDLARAGLDELRARSEKLSRRKPARYTRVYIPDGDAHINTPDIPGRPYTSLHHLVHICDAGRVPPAPATNAGKYTYGVKIESIPTPAEEK